MAIIGINTDKENPPFTIADFLFWRREYKKYMETDEGKVAFDNLYPIANNKIFYSIFGSDWKYAMSLCIAHYLYIIGQSEQNPGGSTLGSIAGGVTKGLLTSATVGGFSKTFDLDKSLVNGSEYVWWNKSAYGAELIALLTSKGVPSIMVITSGPIPGSN